jgi:hypothetical protein
VGTCLYALRTLPYLLSDLYSDILKNLILGRLLTFYRLWRDKDGSLYYQGRWWAIPEETAEGRQPWHGRRELFRSNMVDENEVHSSDLAFVQFGASQYSRLSTEHMNVVLTFIHLNTVAHF